jgi:putative ABC transport system permease protein
LLERLKSVPGVVAAAVSSNVPPYGGRPSKIEISGKSHQEDWQAMFENVSDDYFQVLRIESKRGRTFNETETKEARKVAVINEAFARTYFSNSDPMGQRVRFSSLAGAAHDAWFEIIGVVGDVTNSGLQTPVQPEAWLPWTIQGAGIPALMVRTSLDPATMQDAVSQQVWAADSGVALAYPGTLEAFIGERLYAGPRFGFLLMTVFGCVGLLLVMVGVYSVLAYSTTRQTHEIGIRMALGAKAADVLGMVIRTGLRLVLVGMAVGIAISFLLTRLIATQLTGVTPHDPATLVAMTLLLTGAATIACWIPARKAARVDPMIALRYE